VNQLIITRGLPGAGKTTLARAWVKEDPGHRARVNRDDIRAMLHDSTFIKGVTEQPVIATRDALIMTLLGRGLDVICDDTNLPQRTARDLRNLATRAGTEFDVWDMTDVDFTTCYKRNLNRTDKDPIALGVMNDMCDRYLKGKSWPLPRPQEPAGSSPEVQPYVNNHTLPPAIIIDIDGTVALKGTRDPFDESLVHRDQPNHDVIHVVQQLVEAGHYPVFLSGRSDKCLDATYDWIVKHVALKEFDLHMRKAGDYRKDCYMKMELFDKHVRDKYDVLCVFDDRDQVVSMWRDLGLTCMQVAPGEF
jgi:predicted kinase